MFRQPIHKLTRPRSLGLAEQLNLGESDVSDEEFGRGKHRKELKGNMKTTAGLCRCKINFVVFFAHVTLRYSFLDRSYVLCVTFSFIVLPA
jgi:hypothetical protein